MIYPVIPRPYVRTTQRGKWSLKYQRYVRWKGDLQKLGVHVPDEATLIFYMPMPRAWSRAKMEEHLYHPHQRAPDLDNLVKAVLDAARYGLGDHSVWSLSARKIWSYDGRIEVITGLG